MGGDLEGMRLDRLDRSDRVVSTYAASAEHGHHPCQRRMVAECRQHRWQTFYGIQVDKGDTHTIVNSGSIEALIAIGDSLGLAADSVTNSGTLTGGVYLSGRPRRPLSSPPPVCLQAYSSTAGDEKGFAGSTTNMISSCRSAVPVLEASMGVSGATPARVLPASTTSTPAWVLKLS